MSSCKQYSFKYLLFFVVVSILLYGQLFDTHFNAFLPKFTGFSSNRTYEAEPQSEIVAKRLQSFRSINITSTAVTNTIEDHKSDNTVIIESAKQNSTAFTAIFNETLGLLVNYNCSYDHVCMGSIRVVSSIPNKFKWDQVFCSYKFINESSQQLEAVSTTEMNGELQVICVLMQSIHKSLSIPQALKLNYFENGNLLDSTNFIDIKYPACFSVPQDHSNRFLGFQPSNNIKNYQVDHWQLFGNTSMLFSIYSAYFDERLEVFEYYECPADHICFGSIRVTSLMLGSIQKEYVFCYYKYPDGHIEKAKAVNISVILDYNSHQTFIVLCVVKQNIHKSLEVPESVGLGYFLENSMVNSTSFTYVRYPNLLDPSVHSQKQINQIAACVPAFFNFTNSLRIVEFVELYKILGVSKFYFYNLSVSEDVNKLLNYYQEHENVTVLEWNTQVYEGWKHIYYEAISACFSECYYRASFKDNYKYILMLDIDEFIIPRMENVTTLPQFLKKLDNDSINSFNVPNVFMAKEVNQNIYDYVEDYDERDESLEGYKVENEEEDEKAKDKIESENKDEEKTKNLHIPGMIYAYKNKLKENEYEVKNDIEAVSKEESKEKSNEIEYNNNVEKIAEPKAGLRSRAKNGSAVDVNGKNQLFTQTFLEQGGMYPYHFRSKMIAKGKFLNILSNHHYLQSAKYKVERYVHHYEALLYHYREVPPTSFEFDDTEHDTGALKYSDQLINKVDFICKLIYADGICPVESENDY